MAQSRFYFDYIIFLTFFVKILSFSKILLIFATENHAQNPLSCRYNITGAQQDGREEMLKWSISALGIIYMIKAFINALFLTLRNSGRFLLSSKGIATIDAHGCIYTSNLRCTLLYIRCTVGLVYYIHKRGLLCCSF